MAPAMATPESQREANLVFSVLRAQAIGLGALALMFGVTAPKVGAVVAILLASMVCVFAAMAVAQGGRVHWASYFAIFTAVSSTTISTLLVGGMRSAVVLSLIFGPTVAAVSRRSASRPSGLDSPIDRRTRRRSRVSRAGPRPRTCCPCPAPRCAR